MQVATEKKKTITSDGTQFTDNLNSHQYLIFLSIFLFFLGTLKEVMVLHQDKYLRQVHMLTAFQPYIGTAVYTLSDCN